MAATDVNDTERQAICDAITWLAMLEREHTDLPGIAYTTAALRRIVADETR